MLKTRTDAECKKNADIKNFDTRLRLLGDTNALDLDILAQTRMYANTLRSVERCRTKRIPYKQACVQSASFSVWQRVATGVVV